MEIWQIPRGDVEKIISNGKNNRRFEYIEPDYTFNTLNLANIISVASTPRTDGLSWFSNPGATTVDLAAPGSDI